MGPDQHIRRHGAAHQRLSRLTLSAALRLVFSWFIAALAIGPAFAQTTTTYSNSTTGAIGAGTACPSSPLVRNFTVSTSYTISDVDLGLLVTHTWRGDLRVTLQSPADTRVQLVNGDANNISGDNFNVRLNDSGIQTVNTDAATGNHGTSAPPYANDFSPNSPLSAFIGENSSGTWRLEICDLYPSADSGTFERADLYLTSMPANRADLSLAKTVSNGAPANGSAISYTLTVANAAASTQTATGIIVTDILPGGFSYTSSSGTGTYNPSTGQWSVGSLAPGASASITINGTVTASAGATVVNTAEITASSQFDPDSTVNNGATGEDDYATRSFIVSGTRTAGTPPTLVCPAGTSLLDWNSQSWTSGSSTGSATLPFIGTVNFAVTTEGSYSVPLALTSDNTGGFASTELSLFQSIEYTNRNQVTTTTVTLPTAVPGVQFRVFDIDYAVNDFADKLTVVGSFGGSTVYPTLTNGIANYVAGNVAIGDAGSGGTSANGNVVVTFSSPVDTIVITYGNHTTAPADPDGQAISIHDFTFCRPVAVLSVAKTSSVVSDPSNGTTDPKAIPGAVMLYCILVTNPGSGTATSVTLNDAIPAQTTFVPGSIRSGSSCAAAATLEDDNAAGADESDPVGASFAGTTLSATVSSLLPSTAMAIIFNATVN